MRVSSRVSVFPSSASGNLLFVPGNLFVHMCTVLRMYEKCHVNYFG